MKFEKQDSGIESAHSAITLVKVASEELQTKNFQLSNQSGMPWTFQPQCLNKARHRGS